MADPVDDVGQAPTVEPDDFEVSVEWRNRLVVLTIQGTVDLVTAPQLSESILNALENRPSAIIVDLTQVQFFASAGMTVLVAAHEEVSTSARFAVVAEGSATSRPMRLVGVDRIVAVYPDVKAALSDLEG